MADRAIRDIMEQSIEELPDELRTAFVACVVDGMMPEQFAEFLAFTSEAVEGVCTMPKICWLYASSVSPLVRSIGLTMAVPSALRTQ
jgi:hypothetical protein